MQTMGGIIHEVCLEKQLPSNTEPFYTIKKTLPVLIIDTSLLVVQIHVISFIMKKREKKLQFDGSIKEKIVLYKTTCH